MPNVVELLFKASGASARRFVQDFSGDMDRMGKTAKRSSEDTSTGLKNVGKSAGLLRGAFGSILGVAGIGGLAFGFADAAKGAIALQASQTQLQNSLTGVGVKSKEARDSVEKITGSYDAMGARAGASTDELLSGLGRLIGVTHNVAQAQTANSAAIALATKTGMSYGQALNDIVSAEAGRTRGLAAVIGPVTATKTAEQNLATQIKLHNAQLSAQAASMGKVGKAWLANRLAIDDANMQQKAAAATADKVATGQQIVAQVVRYSANAHESLAQKAQDAKQHFQDLVATIGETFLPAMDKVITAVSVATGWLTKHKAVMYVLLGLVGLLAAAESVLAVKSGLVAIGEAARAIATTASAVATGAATAATWLLNAALIALDALPVVLVFVAIGVAIYELATHFKVVEKVIGIVWGAIVTGAKAVGRGVSIAITTMVKFIETIAGRIFNALTWPFRKAVGAIKTILHGAGGVIGKIGGALGFASGGPVGPRRFQAGGAVGSDVIPALLNSSEGVLTARGMQAVGGPAGLNAVNAGATVPTAGAQQLSITYAQPIIVRLDSRVLTQAVVQQTLRNAARGPASLTGGALSTGVSTVA